MPNQHIRIHKLTAENSDLVNFPQVTFFRKVGFFQVTYIRKRGAPIFTIAFWFGKSALK